jgi:hypothetical protein
MEVEISMGSYLQHYGVGEERRNRAIIKIIALVVGAAAAAILAYLLLQNYAEKQKVRSFLELVNSRQYGAAYRAWGCGEAHPCPNYNYERFMEDWGPSKAVEPPWKIASVDGCRAFVTVNVQAPGSDLQSLMVERGNKEMGFAPAPECQERKWRWKQFVQRIFGGS